MANFLDLLRSGKDIDCDLIIGGSDMPASFVWYKGSKIYEYGIEKFKPIMDAEYEVLDNGNIEIFCDDWKLGERFCYAAAGYISESEFRRMFNYF